jgi:hypothetical protein
MRAYRTGQGNWQLNFIFDGKQRTLSLGRHCGRVSADRTARIVSELLTVRKMGDSVPSDLLQRVGTFPARVRDSLCRSGLDLGIRREFVGFIMFSSINNVRIHGFLRTASGYFPAVIRMILFYKSCFLCCVSFCRVGAHKNSRSRRSGYFLAIGNRC